MNETRISENPRRNHVVAVVSRDGQTYGHVVMRGRRFEASRKNGAVNDMRRYANNFGSIEAAVRFVEAGQ